MHPLRPLAVCLLMSFSALSQAQELSLPHDASFASPRPSERLPSFPLDAWKSRQTGPRHEPYFLQDQLFHLRLLSPTDLDARDKKIAAATLFAEDKATVLQEFHVQMKPRGSSSLGFPKKQHSFKLVTSKGQRSPSTLLDMPQSDEWILAAPYNDKSLLRDLLTFNLSNSISRYASRTRLVSVSAKIGDREEAPKGLYVITEKSALIAPHRLNIPEASADGRSAYVLKIDRVKDKPFVRTARGLEVIVAFPDAKDLTAERKEDILAHLNAIEQRLGDRNSQGYRDIFVDLVELESAIDFFLLQELSRNVDAYRLSSPMYIPPGGMLHFGPVWDFNLGYGNANYENGWLTTGWRAKEIGVWFETLMDHPAFCRRLKQKWPQLRDSAWSNNSIFHTIDSHVRVMAPAINENFQIWGGLGQHLWPNPYWLATHAQEIDALKSWIALRAEWMDQSIATMSCSST